MTSLLQLIALLAFGVAVGYGAHKFFDWRNARRYEEMMGRHTNKRA